MGNCVFSGLEEEVVDGLMIKVVTFNGGVMELHPPVMAECITNGFPGHGIYHSQDLFSKPLMHNEELCPGEQYYLRPLSINPHGGLLLPSMVAPYRVSSDDDGGGGAAWRVKLVISPAKLSEILAQDSRTEALIESMRMVAKCGSGVASSVASSDQWSLASSRKGPLLAGQ
ncbi:hypothetical protein J5N97_021635 [Dioscorea zingiberensis]|uniref:Uncharacterized protein n=1 Tax=Dioscorea zingiberensis TaxID=325984 RepID=A0A9D5C998_9LILI|nr:hypothetical protein J5N97_021635 [Dioscorea zingiberensis]